MIEPPSGWTVTRTATGHRFLSPEGPSAGEIRYRLPKLLGDFEVLVRADPLADDGLRGHLAAPQALVTIEGNYASLTSASAVVGGRRVERHVGLVCGDYVFTRLTGVVHDPRQFEPFAATMRTLLVSEILGLGERRRRRFRYQPPAAWTPTAFDLETSWTAPGAAVTLTVLPALPIDDDGGRAVESSVDASLHGGRFRLAQVVGPTALVSRRGLVAKEWLLTGQLPGHERISRHIIVGWDERHAYPLRLDAGVAEVPPEMTATLRELFDSIVPIPPFRRKTATEVGQQWVD